MAPEGARLGVAVSGGADSVALLDVLRRLGYSLHILHVNHQLRGAESEGDEQFVRELGGQHGLPVEVLRAEPPGGAENLEQALRRIRYSFFEQARRELRLERVATGHTRSDQAETVLLRLARGAGAQGLRGIHPVTRQGIIRPLLEVSRVEIRLYLRRRGLAWREDSSNADNRLERNRIRSGILPLLAELLNPRLEEALARTAALAWEEEEDWQRRAAEAIEGLGPLEWPLTVETEWLRKLGPALGRRVVRRLLAEAAGSGRRLTFEHADSVWRLATGEQGSGRVRAPGAEVWRSLGWVRFGRPGEGAGTGAERVVLEAEGRAELGSWVIEAGRTPPDSSACYAEVSELDGAAVTFPLTLRFRSPGDRFQPAGREAPVKVKELLQKAGVPSWERAEWPMVESGGRIAWCRGFGAAEWARPRPDWGRRIWIAAARKGSAK
jgi:tRNA(Ile)-lysidine synthase